MRFTATLAALLLTVPAFAQISTGDTDTDHNATDWRSARWVAPKKVEVWTLVIVWTWPNIQTDRYPIFDSREACLMAMGNIDLKASLATASCVNF